MLNMTRETERGEDFCPVPAIYQIQYQIRPTRNLLQSIVGHDYLQLPQLMSLSSITLTVPSRRKSLSLSFFSFFFTADGLLFMQSCRRSHGARSPSFITEIVRQEAAVCVNVVRERRAGMTEEPIRDERDLFV